MMMRSRVGPRERPRRFPYDRGQRVDVYSTSDPEMYSCIAYSFTTAKRCSRDVEGS